MLGPVTVNKLQIYEAAVDDITHELICLFVVYLMKLSVSQTIKH
jgi:hypothetical protein